jgi:hypothetical protein
LITIRTAFVKYYIRNNAGFPKICIDECQSNVILIKAKRCPAWLIISLMSQSTAEIIEVRLEGDHLLSGRMVCSTALKPLPGQYLLADAADDLSAPLPVVLYISAVDGTLLDIAPPLPVHWSVGTRLSLRGPLGNGFYMPPAARRVVLAGFTESIHRLLPLVAQAIRQGADVALYTDSAMPSDLPLAVEMLPINQLPGALLWADYLALDARLDDLPEARERLNLSSGQTCPCAAEVLVHVPMPCGGTAECFACAVQTRAGWMLACKDGPVFDFNRL